MTQIIYQVDAFTSRPFAGNPAAVCLLTAPAPERWMQRLAQEMNLSETAFLYPEGDGFKLRWMTPAVEVDLCGHATLAAAHVLWETGALSPDEQARFHTRSGLLTATRHGDHIELDLPARPPELTSTPPDLASALGAKPVYVGRNADDFLVELISVEEVMQASPDLVLLRRLPAEGVIVTARAAEGPYDFVSRYFAPAVGIDEDPVTGAAHTCLGPYWARKLGRQELMAYQASARGGELQVRVAGERVLLTGRAVTVLRCELLTTAY